jgi:hypothetical protein
MLYTSQLCLDKSMTRCTWSVLLDPEYSSLSTRECHKRIIYASSDCFAVTYLHRPICESWSLSKLHESELIDLFISLEPASLSLSSLSMFLEDISEDEDVETHRVLGCLFSGPSDTQPSVNATQKIVSLDNVIVAGSITDLRSSHHGPLSIEPPPRRAIRSAEARNRRNHRRNRALRPRRDRHVLLRPLYHRFNISQIKNILRERQVRYIHLKIDKRSNCLSIGVKHSNLVDVYFDRIPGDLFDECHYNEYRGRERTVFQ